MVVQPPSNGSGPGIDGFGGNGGFDGVGSSGMGGFGGVNWSSVNTGIGAFGLGNGVKTELFKYASKFSHLNQSATNYLKVSKVVGNGIFYFQAGISLYNAGEAIYNNDSNKWGVIGKSTLDITMGALSVWGGPVGLLIGSVYFIGDAAGWWGDWGKPAGY